MTNLSLRQLRAIIAISTKGTIVSAARMVGLTAPAVTLQLKQLEQDAGVALFDRTAHGMRPTAAGLVFIAAAADVEKRLRVLDEELDGIRGARKGVLNVGVVSNAEYFAPQLIAAFLAEFPDIEVRLVSGRRPETMLRLKHYDVDFVLTARPPRDLSVRAAAFADYQLAFVASPIHPLVAVPGISKEEIRKEQFIVREPGSGPRASFERFLGGPPERLGVHYIEMASNDEIRRAVMAEFGIAFVALHSVTAAVAAKQLVVLDVEGLPIQSQWFAVSRSDRSMTPIMSVFQEFLTTKGAHYLQSHDAPYGQE